MTENAAQVERGQKRLAHLFQPRPEHKCQRCQLTVYQYERISPRQDVVFHTSCFRCVVCNVNLTLKNSCSNQHDAGDNEIYCQKHCPQIDAPKMNADAIIIKRALTAPKAENEHAWAGQRGPVGVDLNALYIRGPLNAQKLQKGYEKLTGNSRHHYPAHIQKKRQEVIDAQKQLEDQLREEEDELIKGFKEERTIHSKNLNKEIDEEWESRLKELTAKYDKMGIGSTGSKKGSKKGKNGSAPQTEDFENEKSVLAKTMTLKMEKRKKTMTLKLLEKEQGMTSSMVKKQSEQMLSMLAQKKEELKIVLEKELERQQQELLEANMSVQSADFGCQTEDMGPNDEAENADEIEGRHVDRLVLLEEALGSLITAPPKGKIPPPAPPSCSKRSLYEDVVVFSELDEQVIQVAENEQVSYTDLVHQLTEYTFSDLEKARAIYRWITVKDLNVMEFDETVDSDTPMGLLRGIKYGTETYHTLFMRLCSYAGLPCEEIKGHSKSVGYEPGMKIRPETFQNTWNAVLVNGDWRLVQCNWGARHLVLNKDRDTDKKKKDQIRYQYDEHYFLTDPDEFIQEFWPYEGPWQLLDYQITLEEFEDLPFVRSIFFHYQMKFEGDKKAVIETNEKGGSDITIRVPEGLQRHLVFYYQLRFADKDRRNDTTFKNSSLERFVYQTMVENTVMFSVHVPTTGEYFFEVFANKITDPNDTDADHSTPGTPFRLKCACKFKIVCNQLTGKMYPLPNCASGEWGPKKAYRHFNILPLYDVKSTDIESQENLKAGIIYGNNDFELKFVIPRPLQFVAKLRMNHVDDHVLDPFVRLSLHKDILTAYAVLPQPGQYGLDIYARPREAKDSHTLSHACKYLINCSGVDAPVEIPKNVHTAPVMSKDKWGPSAMFDRLGLKTLSHKDSVIRVSDSSHLIVDIEAPPGVHASYQFIREPDEDDREYVSMVRETKRVRFYVNMPKSGNYMLALYARHENSDDKSLPNVYNYLIQYNTEITKLSNGNSSTPASKFSSTKGEYQINKGDKTFLRRFSPKKDKS